MYALKSGGGTKREIAESSSCSRSRPDETRHALAGPGCLPEPVCPLRRTRCVTPQGYQRVGCDDEATTSFPAPADVSQSMRFIPHRILPGLSNQTLRGSTPLRSVSPVTFAPRLLIWPAHRRTSYQLYRKARDWARASRLPRQDSHPLEHAALPGRTGPCPPSNAEAPFRFSPNLAPTPARRCLVRCVPATPRARSSDDQQSACARIPARNPSPPPRRPARAR